LFASSFPGLAQIGLYSLTGLVAAALTTRYILPAWLPPGFAPAGSPRFGRWLARLVALAPRWRWLPIVCATLGALALWLAPQKLWQNELLALSPVPAAAISEDARLRGELAAPDARHLIVVLADNDEAALAASTALSPLLADLQARQKLAGWDSPANYLPDIATQKQRLTSIPEGGELIRRLKLAAQGLPLSADKLTPFVQDAQAARTRPPLTRKDLTGTSLALALDALLFEAEGRAVALLPLVAPLDERALGQALDVWQRTHPATQALLIDTKAESDAIYADYLAEILRLTGIGVAVILLLLGLSLKSAKKALRVALPITAAVLTVLGGLMLAGQSLILLHLIGLMLIVAIGSNYALFFTDKDEITPQTSASIAFACATTVAGFTPLAFSFVPILQAIGITVAPGALLALVFSAMLAGRRRPA
jgi:predicted exporter